MQTDELAQVFKPPVEKGDVLFRFFHETPEPPKRQGRKCQTRARRGQTAYD